MSIVNYVKKYSNTAYGLCHSYFLTKSKSKSKFYQKTAKKTINPPFVHCHLTQRHSTLTEACANTFVENKHVETARPAILRHPLVRFLLLLS